MAYLKSYFFLDFLMVMPGIFIGENYPEGKSGRQFAYELKLLKFIYIGRFFSSFEKLVKIIQKKFQDQHQTVSSIFKLFKYVVDL